ncbi:hypothetical protein M8494_29360 [Serratia ureilytica]
MLAAGAAPAELHELLFNRASAVRAAVSGFSGHLYMRLIIDCDPGNGVRANVDDGLARTGRWRPNRSCSWS